MRRLKPIWDRIKHFSPRENWGDPNKVAGQVLLGLDAVRDAIGWPIIIHCAYELDGHSPNSYHYRGLAVDFHFGINYPFYYQVGRLLKVLADLQLSKYVGLGVYPYWHHPGFHLDFRGYRARWGRIGKKYVSWDKILEEIKHG